LNKFAGDLRATHPHFAYTPRGEPQALHNAGRLAWGSGPRGERPDYTGLDVIIVCGDKIAALYVFPDSMPLWRKRMFFLRSTGMNIPVPPLIARNGLPTVAPSDRRKGLLTGTELALRVRGP
jgi:hypothetical protein